MFLIYLYLLYTVFSIDIAQNSQLKVVLAIRHREFSQGQKLYSGFVAHPSILFEQELRTHEAVLFRF